MIKNLIFLEGITILDNTISNVHVCGLVSANGYSYDPMALKEAIALYEKADVYANHKDERLIEDKIGWVEGISFVEGSGLWAKKMVLNEKHPLYEQTMWWAQNNSKKLGLSHSVNGKLNEEKKLVEKISAVESVDLVAQPATVAGLHESIAKQTDTKIRLDRLVSAAYDLATSTLWAKLTEAEKSTKLQSIFKELIEEIKPSTKEETQMELKDLTVEMLLKDRPDLVKQISEAAQKIEKRILEALAKVPEKARTPIFESQIRAVSTDEKALTALVEDRIAVSTAVVSAEAPASDKSGKNDDKIDEAKIAEEIKKSLGL